MSNFRLNGFLCNRESNFKILACRFLITRFLYAGFLLIASCNEGLIGRALEKQLLATGKYEKQKGVRGYLETSTTYMMQAA